jgi:5-bromo-4-chloroindolyl phosphate hydrolysis protein
MTKFQELAARLDVDKLARLVMKSIDPDCTESLDEFFYSHLDSMTEDQRSLVLFVLVDCFGD